MAYWLPMLRFFSSSKNMTGAAPAQPPNAAPPVLTRMASIPEGLPAQGNGALNWRVTGAPQVKQTVLKTPKLPVGAKVVGRGEIRGP